MLTIHVAKHLLVNILQLKDDDVFLDLGHGIGNICIQAAYTIGCEARGIELVKARHLVAKDVLRSLTESNAIRMATEKTVSLTVKRSQPICRASQTNSLLEETQGRQRVY
jgi:cyclopropane fatty-acyl-phospholipid synthase-like methyltransferase